MRKRLRSLFVALMAYIVAFSMVPGPVYAADAIMDADRDAEGNITHINKIQLDPYTYTDWSSHIGGGNDLTTDALMGISEELFKYWGPIAYRAFETNQNATWHNSDDWDDYLRPGVTAEDQKVDLKKYLTEGNAFTQGKTSHDNVIATGLSYATNINSILDEMCQMTAEAMGDRHNTPASVIYDKMGLEDIKKMKDDTKAFYRSVTSVDNNGETFGYYFNTYSVILYDFSLAPIVAPGVTAANSTIVQDTTESGDQKTTNVSYFENKSQSESEISAELSTETVESVSNTISNSKSFSYTESVGAESEIESFLGIADFTQHFTVGFEASQAIETGYEDSKGIEDHFSTGTSASATLPPHTAISVEQKSGKSGMTVTYDCPVALRYKVCLLSINGFRYDDRALTKGWTDTTEFSAIFGAGTNDGGYGAPENLYIRAVNPKTYNKMERAYGSVLGKRNGRTVTSAIDWSKFGDYTSDIQKLATEIPMFASGCSMSMTKTSKSTELGAIIPLYQLTHVDLTEGENQYQLTAGDSMSLGSLAVDGFDNDDVEYYGFDGGAGYWVLSDAAGNPLSSSSVLSLETNAATGRQTVKGLSAGEAYIMWVMDDGAEYQGKYGNKVTSSENTPDYPLVQFVVNRAIADLSGYRVEAEGEAEVIADEKLSLPNAFPASVFDRKDRLISRAVTYEQQDLSAPITIDADGTFVASEAGDYKVRAVYARDGASIESPWFVVHVTPAPVIDAVTADPAELDAAGGKADIVLTGEHLHDGIAVTLTDESGNTLEATTTGSDVEQRATFELPANEVFDDDAIYTASYEVAEVTTDTTTTVTVVANTLSKVEAKDAGCEEAGAITYWKCNETGELYADALGSRIISLAETVVPATGHTLAKVEAADATCEADGNIAYWECSNCGDCFADEAGEQKIDRNDTVVPALNHEWDEGVETTPATCEADGVLTYTCKHDATHTRTDSIPAIGHEWDEGVVTTEPGCETPGVKTYTCKHDATHTKTEEIAATGHDWDEWVVTKEATDTENGEEQRTCKNDPTHVETRTIPKGMCDHATLTEVPAADASCTTDGNVQHWVCDDCGKAFADAAAQTELALDDTIVPATGHKWDEGTETTPATCTKDGVMTYTCTNAGCGATKTEAIPATGHEWGEGTETTPATCTTDGIRTISCTHSGCTASKTETIPALGHEWDEGTETKAATCTKDGVLTYTCTHDASHTRTEAIPATGHEWDEGTVTTEPTCTKKGERTFTCTHGGCDATRTEPVKALGHAWDEGTVTKEPTCTTTGTRVYHCTRDDCTATKTETIDKLGHEWGAWESIGDTQHQKVCAHDASHTKVASHRWRRGVVTKPATVLEAGERTYTCRDCGATRTEEIDRITFPSILLARMTPNGAKAMDVSWNRIKGVDGYEVWFVRCSDEDGATRMKRVKTVWGDGNLFYTKTGLRRGQCYKTQIRAFVELDGRRVYVKISPVVHCITGGGNATTTNPAKVSIEKRNITLWVGRKTQIKASVTGVAEDKELISELHAAELRFKSTNTKVATVGSGGKITAKAPGTCRIYVYAANGARSFVTVTVR